MIVGVLVISSAMFGFGCSSGVLLAKSKERPVSLNPPTTSEPNPSLRIPKATSNFHVMALI